MDLTVIGFIISAVALILQVADAFPEHREARKAIVFMTVGMFLGIVASGLLGAHYEITGNVDRSYALLFALVGGSLFCVILAFFARSDQQRDVASTSAGIFAFIFCLAGFATALGSTERGYAYKVDEVAALADRAEQIGDYDTALDRLTELRSRLRTTGARDTIQRRIDQVQQKQISGKPAK